MTRLFLLVASLIIILPVFGQQITVRVDKPLHAYEVGETVVFKVESPLRGLLTYRIGYAERSGLPTMGTIDYRGGVIEIAFPTRLAAFVLFKAQIAGQSAELGVVIGRDKIKALVAEPADYDAFWAQQKAQLAAIPIDKRVEKIAENTLSTTYRFDAAQIDGRRVYGYFVVPKGGDPKPACLRIPPFGESAFITAPQTELAEKGNMIAFSITIHNAPVEQVDPLAYKLEDARNREQIYYRYAVLAAMRAIDVLATLPEWNQKDLLVYGDSQGGGLAILTAGLDARVSLLLESVGALSQLNGEKFSQPSGFPYYLSAVKDIYGSEAVEQASRAIRYYDAIYAARRFRGPSMHYSNYLDAVCPPATIYAAMNAAAGPKVIRHSINLGHTNPPTFFEDVFDFARLHFEGARRAPFIYASKRLGYDIDAGPAATATSAERLVLKGRAGVDGGSLGEGWSVAWSKVSGPGDVKFDTPQQLASGVGFTAPGTYVLQLQVTVVDPNGSNLKSSALSSYVLLSDEVTVTVTAGASATADPLTSLERVAVYPNPASSYLEVAADFNAADEISIELYDAVGRLVERRGPVDVDEARTQVRERFDVAAVPEGAYVLLLQGRSGTYRQSVIVAR